jgi:hypothetical protein
MPLLLGLATFPALIGLFVVVRLLQAGRHPADDTNIFNAMRLLWYALSPKWRGKLARLVDWLRRDEGELLPLPDPPSTMGVDAQQREIKCLMKFGDGSTLELTATSFEDLERRIQEHTHAA